MVGKVVIRFWANWSTSRPSPLTSQSFHFGCMSDLCGLLPSSPKLLCLLGRLAMKRTKQSGMKSASVSGLQIPGGISSPPTFKNQLSCQSSTFSALLPAPVQGPSLAREGASLLCLLPLCPPLPSHQPSPGWLSKTCLSSCLQNQPCRLPPSDPDTPPFPTSSSQICSPHDPMLAHLILQFPLCRLPPPPCRKQHILLGPSQE